MTDSKKIISYFLNFCLFTAFVLLFVNPDTAEDGVRKAISFCLSTVIPSLFVYIFAANYFIPRLSFLYRIRSITLAIIIIGMLCGFPVGGILASAALKNGMDDKKAIYINAISNQASVTFVVIYAGGAVLKSTVIGWVIVLFQFVSALCAAFVVKKVLFPRGYIKNSPISLPRLPKLQLAQSLGNTVKSTASICACIVLFGAISYVTVSLFSLSPGFEVLLRGALEFSSGIASTDALKPYIAFPVVCGLIGWSGLSVHAQVFSVFPKGKRIFWLSKILQTLFMTFLALLTNHLLF